MPLLRKTCVTGVNISVARKRGYCDMGNGTAQSFGCSESRAVGQPGKNRVAGFTLIELMVVVAIIAFVAAAVVPSFSRSLLQNRQREAALMIMESVFATRGRAARTGKCHRLRVYVGTPGGAGGSGGIVAVDSSIESQCSVARSNNQWTRVSYKSVYTSVDPDPGIGGDTSNHAGLVGDDVAIDAVLDSVGGTSFGSVVPGMMLFDPSGGLDDKTERNFRVRIYNMSTPLDVSSRYVRIGVGGNAGYTTTAPAP